jgi:exopolysaccharide/PEP-CTERM locus tyrosine autokinase
MSIIEQATRRLEELKRAGVEVPAWEPNSATPAAPVHGSAAAPSAIPTGATPTNPTPTSVTPIHRVEPLRPVEPYPGSNPAAGSGSSNAGSIYGSHAAADSSAHDRAAGSSARDRAAGTVASGALVRVGLRQSKSVELDLAKLAQAGYLVPGAPRSPLADEFRGIKQPVLKNVRGEAAQAGSHANLIMITSALAGEGKTFCSLNLALSIASEVDSSVLLVDADVVRPSVMSRLGLQGRFKGLLDLLSDTSLDLPDLILKTNIPKLAVLPAGAPSIHSTELLASDAMQELLNDIATRYPDRIVIFDAPPLLSTTESRVLAARMGQIIMVVSAGTTAELDIKQAFTALEHCTTVLCLLNRSSNDSDQRHYGYYAQ